MAGMDAHYDALWPRSPRGVQQRRRAPRLGTLAGMRVGFLWDYVFRGDENPLRDIGVLFKNGLGERGLEGLPERLGYLRS